jgi:transcriptional regulator GlxA family with amidase domain
MQCANDLHRRDVHVDKAIAAMRAAPRRRWTVAALARIAGLSRAPFARRFRESTGMSPFRWLTELRLGLAKERLRETDLPLATLASELGYSSEFALSKAFKRTFGLAPGRFRRLTQRPLRPMPPLVRAAA